MVLVNINYIIDTRYNDLLLPFILYDIQVDQIDVEHFIFLWNLLNHVSQVISSYAISSYCSFWVVLVYLKSDCDICHVSQKSLYILHQYSRVKHKSCLVLSQVRLAALLHIPLVVKLWSYFYYDCLCYGLTCWFNPIYLFRLIRSLKNVMPLTHGLIRRKRRSVWNLQLVWNGIHFWFFLQLRLLREKVKLQGEEKDREIEQLRKDLHSEKENSLKHEECLKQEVPLHSLVACRCNFGKCSHHILFKSLIVYYHYKETVNVQVSAYCTI